MATGSRHESYLFVLLHILMRLLLLCLLLFPPIISSLDADFPALWELHAHEAAPTHIPNVAHFIYVFVQEVGWTEYIAIRSARDFLHVDTINIWTPPGAVFPGEMWERILALPSVVVRTVDMPDSVFGHQVMKPAHVADLVRLRVMYEEGGEKKSRDSIGIVDCTDSCLTGIYMDTNLVAFRSSDDVLFNTSLRPTIMAIEGNVGLCNALIISQPRSPFLQRWMEKYTKFDDDLWNNLSVAEPYRMYEAGDPDISVLDDHAWFYPMYNDNSRGFYTMWLGKSWHDIDRSYGVHFWAWPDSPIPHMLDPQTARTIDTPLFCHLRKLFDDLDGDGYVATPPALNPNCSVVRVEGLVEHARGLFADFGFEGDKEDIKWVDGSGNRLHGWAPVGTARVEDRGTGGQCRHFDAGSWAVLPVPADYDAREGSVVVSLRLDDVDWSQVAWEGREVLLAKIRVENRGQILLDLARRSISSHETELRFRWETEDDDIESMNDRVDWYSVARYAYSSLVSSLYPFQISSFHLLFPGPFG
jgi:hypothetical protein